MLILVTPGQGVATSEMSDLTGHLENYKGIKGKPNCAGELVKQFTHRFLIHRANQTILP